MTEITRTIERPVRVIQIRKGRLTCCSGADSSLSWLVEGDVFRIGSLPENDVVLRDSTVSRNHAEIVRTHDGVLLRDMGSTNGTFVGNMRVREVYLTPETRFRVGQSEMVFTPEDEIIEIKPSAKNSLCGMVGRSYTMREVFAMIERLAPTGLTALITGETGTGKELAARAMHLLSGCPEDAFHVLDCGAIPANLMESELFGHVRGAFTGAVGDRPGIFEIANGGTIFLDEIGELPLELQPKLLRVLEQREIRRIGAHRTKSINARVIAATNRDLQEEVKKGQFREDLYYRLAVVEVQLPPLRERLEDLPLLIEHVLESTAYNPGVKDYSAEVLSVFENYQWPGNVRELANVLARAIPFVQGRTLHVDSLPDHLSSRTSTAAPPASSPALTRTPFKDAKEKILDEFEKQYLKVLLKENDGNISKAARASGMDRKSIARLMKKHQL